LEKFKIYSAVILFSFLFISSINFSIIPIQSLKGKWAITATKIYFDIVAENYDQILPEINTTIKKIESEEDYDQYTLAWLYEMQAKVYRSRQHYHFAIDALRVAEAISQYDNKYASEINYLQRKIDRSQSERAFETKYFSGRQAGMSKSLTGTINIAYIYIDDNRSSKWSGKQRLNNQIAVDKFLQWNKAQGKKYQVEKLDFNVRYFFLKSPKGISKEWLRKRESFPFIVDTLMKQLNYKNLDDFISNIAGRGSKSQVALMFHSNFDGRSFAMQCGSINCKHEYVMLTEKLSDKKYGWALPQTQAHEMLHLFGAADLYRIEKAKDFAVTDVMNYYSRELKYATIDPITAWSIGWQEQPKTPFKIER